MEEGNYLPKSEKISSLCQDIVLLVWEMSGKMNSVKTQALSESHPTVIILTT